LLGSAEDQINLIKAIEQPNHSIPPQRDPNIARSPSGEINDLKANLVPASFEMLFPKVVELLRVAGKGFFPARFTLIDDSSTIGT
jgi:hypothetical protein